MPPGPEGFRPNPLTRKQDRARRIAVLPQESQSENQETIFEGRIFLVTGATSGAGFDMSAAIVARRGRVIRGTSNTEGVNYKEMVKVTGDPGDYVFAADLGDKSQIDRALAQLADKKIVPTDVIHSAAAGMDTFMKGLRQDLNFARLHPEAREERLAKVSRQMREGISESLERSRMVNFEGPKYLFQQLAKISPPGARYVFDSSLWSSLYGQVYVPPFYEGTAYTKNMFEDWLDANGQKMAEEKKIYSAIVSGHLYEDSMVARGFRTLFFPFLSPEHRARIESTSIKRADMVNATLDLLQSNPEEWQSYPERIYVYGPGSQVTREMSPNNPMFDVKFPF